MKTASFNEYDDASKYALKEVVDEVREQWLANGHKRQFWFFISQSSSQKLTKQIVLKWLKALANKGLIYYYAPVLDRDILADMALSGAEIDPLHKWDATISHSLLFDTSHSVGDGIAIDLLDTDLNSLIEIITKNNLLAAIYKDKLDKYYYNNTPLDEINNSLNMKKLLEFLLLADAHELSAEDVAKIASDDGTGAERRRITSEFNGAIKKASNGTVELKTHLCNNKAVSYQLIIH